MGRKVAVFWHASFSIAAGFLYFLFVLPRWPELMGDTAHSLGTALRIVTGAVIALAALPVVFTLLRTRRPEFGTPQLALTLRVWSIVAHVLAGVLIIGTAISEIWLSLNAAGRYLFGIYGAAAAIAVLGIFAFYLSFVAELPPPPPKPIKAKKPKKRRDKKRLADLDETADDETDDETDDDEVVADAADVDDSETPEPEAQPETEAQPEPDTVVADAEATPPAEPKQEAPDETPEDPEPADEPDADVPARLRNRRPTGKGSHRMRRRRTRSGVALDED